MIAVAIAFLLQAFAVASMPVMSVSADADVIVICTGSGMKTVSLSDLGMEPDDLDQYPGVALSDGICALCSLAHDLAITPSACSVSAIDLGAHVTQVPPAAWSLPNGFRSARHARAPPSNA